MEDMKELSKAISKICLGEIKQNTLKFKKNITIKDYLKIISGKTATLFALSLYIGAKESNADERLAKRLGKIGYELGMAFQITDDILEFTSSEQMIGKDIANDIKEGYYSLPIFYTFKENFELFKSGKLDVFDIIDQVKSNGSIAQSKRLAEKYITKVYQRIDRLPDIEAKEILKLISKQLLDRDY
jgi:heptaprenyl diphosphate synthase